MVKDKTGGERQSRLRLARSKWLKEHGFNSAEGLLGALMRGEVVLQIVSVPTPRAADGAKAGSEKTVVAKFSKGKLVSERVISPRR